MVVVSLFLALSGQDAISVPLILLFCARFHKSTVPVLKWSTRLARPFSAKLICERKASHCKTVTKSDQVESDPSSSSAPKTNCCGSASCLRLCCCRVLLIGTLSSGASKPSISCLRCEYLVSSCALLLAPFEATRPRRGEIRCHFSNAHSYASLSSTSSSPPPNPSALTLIGSPAVDRTDAAFSCIAIRLSTSLTVTRPESLPYSTTRMTRGPRFLNMSMTVSSAMPG